MTLIIIWLKNWAFLRLVQKTCWSILKSFYNGEKIPLISPPLHEEKLISNFQVDANLFNTFFASQCTPHPNSSTLPEVQTHFNNARINSTTSTEENIKILHLLILIKHMVQMKSQSAWSRYVIELLISLFLSFLRIVLSAANFQIHGKIKYLPTP